MRAEEPHTARPFRPEPHEFADFLVEVWRFQSLGRDDDARRLLLRIWSWGMDGIRTHREVRVALRLLARVGFTTDAPDEWAVLPDDLEVYRAETDADTMPGLCWTLDREVAESLAARHGLDVSEARVAKANVLAYITHRGEEEIVVHREHVSIG